MSEDACPACSGSGRFVGRNGLDIGECIYCRVAGKVGKAAPGGVAAKARLTRRRNVAAWRREHLDLIAAIRRESKSNRFAGALVEVLRVYGTWTAVQVAAARNMKGRSQTPR